MRAINNLIIPPENITDTTKKCLESLGIEWHDLKIYYENSAHDWGVRYRDIGGHVAFRSPLFGSLSGGIFVEFYPLLEWDGFDGKRYGEGVEVSMRPCESLDIIPWLISHWRELKENVEINSDIIHRPALSSRYAFYTSACKASLKAEQKEQNNRFFILTSLEPDSEKINGY